MILFLYLFKNCCIYCSALVAKANQWLQQNPTVKVKSCESIESERKYKATVADTNTSTLYEWGDHVTEYNRSLR